MTRRPPRFTLFPDTPVFRSETRPLLLTAATDVLELDHVTVRPESGVPPASLGVAGSCAAVPACTQAAAGATTTVAPRTFGTVMVDGPLFPSPGALVVAETRA